MEKFEKKNSVEKQVKTFNVHPLAEKRNRLTRLHPLADVRDRFPRAKRMKKRWQKCPSSMFSVRKYLQHFKDYCKNSSIHGFSYFTNQDIHKFERLCWIVSVTLSMIGCCWLIRDSYQKWDQTPVIVTFSEKMTSIKTIPLPAVTICPEVKSKKEIFDFTHILMDKLNLDDPPPYGLTKDELQLLLANFHICNKEMIQDFVLFFDTMVANESLLDSIKLMAPPMAESLFDCTFRSQKVKCDGLFREIITEDGLCFTFNTLTYDHMFHNGTHFEMNGDPSGFPGRWSMEDGYGDEISESESTLYPFRVLSAGSDVGLVVTLSVKEADFDYICRGPVQGFKVILHPPDELPDVDGQHFRVSYGEDVRLAIKPNVMVTTKSLDNYTPERRMCYFNSERQLHFMKVYSQRNCNLECLANFTINLCNCVQFFMPRRDETPICGELNIFCYVGIQNVIWQDSGIDFTPINTCNCLPACSSIVYDVEMSQSKYEFHKYQKALRLSMSNVSDEVKMAQLSIFFKENEFIASKRSELIGMTDFVAACGGLLGLFMGISLLSIVELVYYFSLRLFCSYRSKQTNIDVEEIAIDGRGTHALDDDKKVGQLKANFYW